MGRMLSLTGVPTHRGSNSTNKVVTSGQFNWPLYELKTDWTVEKVVFTDRTSMLAESRWSNRFDVTDH